MDIENHPIPQDITGFEFKLIGSMTLKQFAYLAGGAGIAWVFYILPVTVFIKIPLAVLFAAFGAALAFVPVSGRPLDTMIKNFLKAAFNPTQYVYQKAGGKLLAENPSAIDDFNKKRLSISEMSEKQLQQFLNALPRGNSRLDKKEMVFFQSLNEYSAGSSTNALPGFVAPHAYANQAPQGQNQTNAPANLAEPETTKPTTSLLPNEDLQKTAALLQKELQEAKAKEANQSQVDSREYLDAHQKVLELQKSLSDLTSQKQLLESRLIDLQKQIVNQQKPVYSASVASDQPPETKLVRSIPASMTKSIGLPTTPEFPNIITGIVKDPRGNPLSNILIEVKDAQGNAVRAFKTNALGHFASATPLTNGDYTIEFDDPKLENKFDKVGFSASGQIILPIEVISVDTREELRRSLFN